MSEKREMLVLKDDEEDRFWRDAFLIALRETFLALAKQKLDPNKDHGPHVIADQAVVQYRARRKKPSTKGPYR